MVVIAGGLSALLLELDSRTGADATSNISIVYSFGPEGARAILSAVASSMMTVAGLTFSVTMLTLQLASSQFGPRLLRNFMRDRGNQIVLGTFIATFVYCLLVLRTVRGGDGSTFVPHFSVAFGVLLAIASLSVLIYFIHHIASSIRIETQLEELADEARRGIDTLYPEKFGSGAARKPGSDKWHIPADFQSRKCCIRAQEGGYLQNVDDEALMRTATEHDLVVRVDSRPGKFVVPEDALLSAYPAERVDESVSGELANAIIIGLERTPHQNLEFSIRRFVEIAQRALSPGINDPTTALYCIDRLREAFLRLARRDVPAAARFDDNKQLRVLAEPVTLTELACPAFAAIARYGMADADVLRRLLDVVEELAEAVGSTRERGVLTDFAEGIFREGEAQMRTAYDRRLAAGGRPGRVSEREKSVSTT